MQRKNNVQFFGLPGAGKTVLFRNLLTMYPDIYEYALPFSRTKRTLLCIGFIIMYPLVSVQFLFFIIGNPISLWSYLGHLVSISCAMHSNLILCFRNKNKIFLIDEGLMQRLLSIVPEILNKNQAKRLVTFLGPLSKNIVVVSGGDFGRFLVASDKMTSRRNQLGDQYMTKWVQRVSQNTEILSMVFCEEKLSIEIDNHKKDNLNEITKILNDKILAQWK